MNKPHYELVAAFITCQLADVVTWLRMDQSRELNPIVIALGPGALVPKAILVIFTAWLAIRMPSPAMTAVLAFGCLIGLFGAWSNL